MTPECKPSLPKIEQTINQSINQPMNQPINNKPINQTMNKPLNQPINNLNNLNNLNNSTHYSTSTNKLISNQLGKQAIYQPNQNTNINYLTHPNLFNVKHRSIYNQNYNNQNYSNQSNYNPNNNNNSTNEKSDNNRNAELSPFKNAQHYVSSAKFNNFIFDKQPTRQFLLIDRNDNNQLQHQKQQIIRNELTNGQFNGVVQNKSSQFNSMHNNQPPYLVDNSIRNFDLTKLQIPTRSVTMQFKDFNARPKLFIRTC